MTIFEYILVLLSVILGLALAQLATGIGELLRSRRRITWSLPYVLWLIYCFMTILDQWTSVWLLRTDARWNLLSVLLLLGNALAIYLAILWLIPRHIGDDTIDLDAFVRDEKRYFLGALLVYCALGIATNLYLLPAGQFDWANYYIAGPLMASMLAAW